MRVLHGLSGAAGTAEWCAEKRDGWYDSASCSRRTSFTYTIKLDRRGYGGPCLPQISGISLVLVNSGSCHKLLLCCSFLHGLPGPVTGRDKRTNRDWEPNRHLLVQRSNKLDLERLKSGP